MHPGSQEFLQFFAHYARHPVFVIVLAALAMTFILRKIQVLTAIAPPPDKWLAQYRYAHRGLHGGGVPENSLAAFDAAALAGYAIELDVRLTKDGCPVAFHDRRLARMTGQKGRVKDFTLAQLKAMRLADTAERIPTVAEVLRVVDGRVPLLFDLVKKGFSGKLERLFYEAVKDYGGKYAVQSFSPFCVRWFKKNAPAVPRGQLACDFRFCFEKELGRAARFCLDKLLGVFKRLETNFIGRPHFISYEFHKVNSKLLKRLREKGALVFAWTIQNEEEYRYARDFTDSVIFENFMPTPAEPLAQSTYPAA